MYFDPDTGRLTPTDDYDNDEIMNSGAGGMYGGPLSKLGSRTRENGHYWVRAVKRSRKKAVRKTRLPLYKIQSVQTLGERNDRFSVAIWIASHESGSSDYLNVAPAWIKHIQQAIHEINYAAPGLQLNLTRDKSEAKIEIFGNANEKCFTKGFVQTGGATIYLHHNWNEKKRTSCHELLRALGAGHWHQRKDRESSVKVKDQDYICRLKDGMLGLSIFDPHSIMIYPEEKMLSRNSEDPVWFTLPDRVLNREMSELDKVALNSFYRPCKGPMYCPTKFGRGYTGLWYCGR